MKIDPVSGKAYLKEWEKNLDCIRSAGFSLGYIKFKDLSTGKILWQVDAQKGNGPRVMAQMPTLDGAVRELRRMLSLFP